MQRVYDDEVLEAYFNVSAMDVVAALLAKTELLYSKEPETEVLDDGEEEFSGADLSDYVVSVVSAVVIGQVEQVPEVQPCSGQSEPSHGRAALSDTDDRAESAEEQQADCAEQRPAEADGRKSAKSGQTGCLDCEESIVPVAERQTGAHPRRGRTLCRYVSRAWVGVKRAGRLLCCCGRRWE
ncbi:uncharacterized protein LOC132952919 [Metopolophium dirhodum]|uniref:uncharacterized protein LOC132952919 n=1 Tax=Metopolophium dirhodum TaxID=44670 RepID=UPI00298FA1E8|nr:uncharacterized protein LOC132952919 [Metopolophium dirhodum]